jgi:serine protease Do
MKFEQPRFEGRQRKTLGIGVDGALDAAKTKALGLPADQGGYEVTSVTAGSVAEKAGLAIGDVIVSVRGQPLSSDDPLRSLQRLVGGAPSKQDVEIGVRRGGKAVTLIARWE